MKTCLPRWAPAFHPTSPVLETESRVFASCPQSIPWGECYKPQARQAQPRDAPPREIGGPLKQLYLKGQEEFERSEVWRSMTICIHKPIFRVPVGYWDSGHHSGAPSTPGRLVPLDLLLIYSEWGQVSREALLRVCRAGHEAMEGLLQPCHFIQAVNALYQAWSQC